MGAPRSTASDPSAPLFKAAREAPVLSAEAEAELIRRFRQDGDEAARAQLLASHLRLVVKTALNFRGYGMALEDLVAEGNLGLVRALETFEAERALRFATYATWWVRAAMFEHVLRFSTPVTFGLSAERKRLFFKLRGLKSRLAGPGEAALDPEQAAEIGRQLSADNKRVVEMEQLLTQRARSLDAPVVEGGPAFGELLTDDSPTAEEVLGERQELMYRRELLKRAWDGLNERERDIVAARSLRERPLKLEELGQKWGVSRERVRQIEVAAMAKLRALVKAMAPLPLSS